MSGRSSPRRLDAVRPLPDLAGSPLRRGTPAHGTSSRLRLDQGHDAEERGRRKAAAVRAYLRSRRLRADLLPEDLFGEPAWDILLDLYAADIEGKRISVSSAHIASAVPAATASRCLCRLVERGLVERTGDVSDARRAHVRLSPAGYGGVDGWVELSLCGGRPGETALTGADHRRTGSEAGLPSCLTRGEAMPGSGHAPRAIDPTRRRAE